MLTDLLFFLIGRLRFFVCLLLLLSDFFFAFLDVVWLLFFSFFSPFCPFLSLIWSQRSFILLGSLFFLFIYLYFFVCLLLLLSVFYFFSPKCCAIIILCLFFLFFPFLFLHWRLTSSSELAAILSFVWLLLFVF